MKTIDIIRQRLINQQIASPQYEKPEEIVRWLVAMQAQEYAHAKWAIGLRSSVVLNDQRVEKAFNDGRILRTHLMRPTWHFVAAEDIRWLLELTAPRVHAVNKYYQKQLKITASLIKRATAIISKALEGKNFQTRNALKLVLDQNKIRTDGMQLAYLMMHAELEGVICSGPREGKQFTYGLIEERAPKVKKMTRDEALAQFCRRYINSRGPASVEDFALWSGLTMKDGRAGFDAVKDQVACEAIDGRDYYFPRIEVAWKKSYCTTFIMPDYDEYGMSYKDRSAINAREKGGMLPRSATDSFHHWLVLDGRMGGQWQPDKKGIDVRYYNDLTTAQEKLMEKAIKRYLKFVGK